MPDPISVTYTTEATGSQDGWYVVAWDGASTLMGPLGADPGGNLIINVGLQFAGIRTYSGGLALEPTFVLGATLLLTADAPFSGDVAVQVRVLNESAPVPYSDALPPTLTGRPTTVQIYGETIAAAGLTQLSIPLTETVVDGTGVSVVQLNSTLRQLMSLSEWPGPLSFSIRLTYAGTNVNLFASEHATGAAPSLTLSEYPFYSGHTLPAGTDGRAVHSARSGFHTGTTGLVEDGYTPGLWVLPHERDPEDEAEYDHYVPSPDEGGTDSLPNR